MARGRLRVYLGAAPGVGKTVAMLGEGRRRASRGTDVVVAVVEDHGRGYTAEQANGLEVLPRRSVVHRGVRLTDLDLPAVLARAPQVALVDELAHTNAPGGVHEKRWQDVQDLLAAGIDVITTVNVQHLESLNDVVGSITGVTQAETVPDEVVRAADQVELIDMTPQALRRRMAHGHIYPPEVIDTALGNYFREGNLTALRELALLWVADRVDEGLAKYRAEHGIKGTWATRERIVVALTGGPEGPMLLRRAARIAGRVAGHALVAVHVVRSDGGLGAEAAEIERQRLLTERLGGTFQLIVGDDIAAAVLDFARAVNSTQIVVGASRHGRLAQLVRPSTSMAVVRGSGDIDVHVVTHDRASRRGSRPPRWRTAVRPRALPWVASVLVPVALALALLPFRDALNLTTVLQIFILGILATALIGGVAAAAVSALIAGLLANFMFTPPYGSLTIAEPPNLFALLVFLAVGVTVASVVDLSRRRAGEAARGRTEAQLLASLAGQSANAADPVQQVLEQARAGFGMQAVVLTDVTVDRPPEVVAVAGALPPGKGDEPDVAIPAGETRLLQLYGHPLAATDRRLAEVVAAQAAVAAERVRLARAAAQAEQLKQSDAVRTAVLAAVSHDLRTPLATIKASVSSLLDTTVAWTADDRDELLHTTDAAADQLDDLLANLLDLSRLQTGAVAPICRTVSIDEVVHRALIGLPPHRIRDEVPDDLPMIDTDPGLLERVLANIIGNALKHSPADRAVRVVAGVVRDDGGRRMQVRIVDHGPGVAERDRERMFAPFQRLGDVPRGAGVGLGLAVARGLAEAVGARIDVDDTPGGGLTMVVVLPLADAP
jgi:two-component system sensor histidine kinase KdpD